jgi:S-adenosylmethionine hydrolase
MKHVPRGWLARKLSPEIMLAEGDLSRVIYIDHYGNAVTGLREVKNSWRLRAGGRRLAYARTFEEAEGPFWHENSMGLVEIAAPRGSAARLLRLRIGSRVAWQRSRR